jgi:hypothetical protein
VQQRSTGAINSWPASCGGSDPDAFYTPILNTLAHTAAGKGPTSVSQFLSGGTSNTNAGVSTVDPSNMRNCAAYIPNSVTTEFAYGSFVFWTERGLSGSNKYYAVMRADTTPVNSGTVSFSAPVGIWGNDCPSCAGAAAPHGAGGFLPLASQDFDVTGVTIDSSYTPPVLYAVTFKALYASLNPTAAPASYSGVPWATAPAVQWTPLVSVGFPGSIFFGSEHRGISLAPGACSTGATAKYRVLEGDDKVTAAGPGPEEANSLMRALHTLQFTCLLLSFLRVCNSFLFVTVSPECFG